ncbi:BglII/BstYI family type II restriction endonuclease [uncultured Megasphaera sp.]|uniref:BglII/BstYI family type II restriction endonuclease n=1 Tax=uncultured Megasphaera sp. TaxID=165188 RepID=UPI00260126BF|nr:BglII/BstYI family type II restriction endonuclease [uncultured Megasphaera sp.]
MFIKTYSYRFADEILSSDNYCDIKNEILHICAKCPLPVFLGKSSKQRQKDVVQQIMNTYFRLCFARQGWAVEPLATPASYEDVLRADFRKTFSRHDRERITVQIEVEFGNIASSYRNYFKFQLSFSYGLTDICVLIVPSYHLANRIDSGVSNFEKSIREIPQAKLSITVPIYVIGLFDVNDDGREVENWNIRDLGISLDVAQNKCRSVGSEHESLVLSYISMNMR